METDRVKDALRVRERCSHAFVSLGVTRLSGCMICAFQIGFQIGIKLGIARLPASGATSNNLADAASQQSNCSQVWIDRLAVVLYECRSLERTLVSHEVLMSSDVDPRPVEPAEQAIRSLCSVSGP